MREAAGAGSEAEVGASGEKQFGGCGPGLGEGRGPRPGSSGDLRRLAEEEGVTWATGR